MRLPKQTQKTQTPIVAKLIEKTRTKPYHLKRNSHFYQILDEITQKINLSFIKKKKFLSDNIQLVWHFYYTTKIKILQ